MLAMEPSFSGLVSESACTVARFTIQPQSSVDDAPESVRVRVAPLGRSPKEHERTPSEMEQLSASGPPSVQPPASGGRVSVSVTFTASSGPLLVATRVKPMASPALTEGASAVFCTWTSAQITWTCALSWPFAPWRSTSAVTVGVLSSAPQSAGETVSPYTKTVTEPPEGRLPRSHVSAPSEMEHPSGAPSPRVQPPLTGGSASVRTTPLAESGPRLVTVMAKPATPPR